MTYAIDKGIPVPSKMRGEKARYPFSSMEIGDSFFVEGKPSLGMYYASLYPKKFTSRRVNENGINGRRYWRIADAQS